MPRAEYGGSRRKISSLEAAWRSVVEEITDEMIVIKPDEEQRTSSFPIEEFPLRWLAQVVGMRAGAGFPRLN